MSQKWRRARAPSQGRQRGTDPNDAASRLGGATLRSSNVKQRNVIATREASVGGRTLW